MLKRRLFCLKTYLLLLIVSLANVPPVCSQTSIFRFRRFFLKIQRSKNITIVAWDEMGEGYTSLPERFWLQLEACFFLLRSNHHWFYRHFWSEARVKYINNNIYIYIYIDTITFNNNNNNNNHFIPGPSRLQPARGHTRDAWSLPLQGGNKNSFQPSSTQPDPRSPALIRSGPYITWRPANGGNNWEAP